MHILHFFRLRVRAPVLGVQNVLYKFCFILKGKVLHASIYFWIPVKSERLFRSWRANSRNDLHEIYCRHLNVLHRVEQPVWYLLGTLTVVQWQLLLTSHKVSFAAKLCQKRLYSKTKLLIDCLIYQIIHVDFIYNWLEVSKRKGTRPYNIILLFETPYRLCDTVPIWSRNLQALSSYFRIDLVEIFFTVGTIQTDGSELKIVLFDVKLNIMRRQLNHFDRSTRFWG